MTASAIKAGWSGPLFVQGDHFQLNAKKYKANADAEMRAVKDIIREGLHAGFYNIDVDTSTLVDLSKEGLDAQQELNFRLSAELTAYIRHYQPRASPSPWAARSARWGRRTRPPRSCARTWTASTASCTGSARVRHPVDGLAKISVQSGTTHGGTVLPDGTIADVAIDFETLRTLSQISRDEYGLSGAVQHGASTLPSSAFGNFPDMETAEIHLATNFQNIVYDHPQFPAELRERMYEHCRQNFPDERKPTDTEQQFIYKARKKALGAFKRELWEMPEENRAAIRATLQEQFDFLFRQLRVDGTLETVRGIVPLPEVRHAGPGALRMKAAEDDWDLSD
jgi:hypothetical protein